MIIVSPDIVLSAVAYGGLGADAPLIGWRTLVTAAGIAATEEETGYPASNLGNPSTALLWKAGTTDDLYITFTVASEDPVDYLAVARHNWGSGQVVVSIEYPDPENESGPWLELIEETLLANDDAVIFRFDPTNLTQIRIRLQPGSVEPQAAVVYVGALLIIPAGIPPGFTPITYGRQTDIATGRSEAGDFLGRIVRRVSLSGSVSFQDLDPAWYRTTLNPFVLAAQTTPFFFAWAPSSYPQETGFCWLTSDPRPALNAIGEFSVTLDYGAVAS